VGKSQSANGGADVKAGGEGDGDGERDEFLAGDREFRADSIGAGGSRMRALRVLGAGPGRTEFTP